MLNRLNYFNFFAKFLENFTKVFQTYAQGEAL